MTDGATKYDAEKTRLDLVATDFVWAIGEVLTFGVGKYGPWNWAKGMEWSRPYGALLRHMTAWASGENKDPESGLSHLAHAGCCLMFLLVYQKRGIGVDDRYKFADPASLVKSGSER